MMEIEIRAELKNGKKLLDTLKKQKGLNSWERTRKTTVI